jgi:hypothetical protein
MPDQPSHAEEGQIERAQGLRKQIERLKKGLVKEDEGTGKEQGKSLKEQLEDRAAEQQRSTDTD